jgi:hypothetical protein
MSGTVGYCLRADPKLLLALPIRKHVLVVISTRCVAIFHPSSHHSLLSAVDGGVMSDGLRGQAGLLVEENFEASDPVGVVPQFNCATSQFPAPNGKGMTQLKFPRIVVR